MISWIRGRLAKYARRKLLGYWNDEQVGEYAGIRIVDCRDGVYDFSSQIERALKMIEQTDERRFQRVVNHLDWIVNAHMTLYGGMYLHWARACQLNLPADWVDESDLSVAWHASFLIHEATHGLLRRRGIVTDEDNWQREEALCVKEENRWITKLEDEEIRSALHEEFDSSPWEELRSKTKWQRFQAIRSSLRRDKKSHSAEPSG